MWQREDQFYGEKVNFVELQCEVDLKEHLGVLRGFGEKGKMTYRQVGRWNQQQMQKHIGMKKQNSKSYLLNASYILDTVLYTLLLSLTTTPLVVVTPIPYKRNMKRLAQSKDSNLVYLPQRTEVLNDREGVLLTTLFSMTMLVTEIQKTFNNICNGKEEKNKGSEEY